MGKLIVLEIYGDFEHGFAVNLAIKEDNKHTPTLTRSGKLPRNPDLLNQYRQWQSLYRNLETFYRSLKEKPGQVTNYSQKPEAFAACSQAAKALEKSMNTWLKLENRFRVIEDELCHQLNSSKDVRVVLRTYNIWLRRLPWHLWDLPLETQPEIIFSVPECELVKKPASPSAKGKVKILAIFGPGINPESEWQALKNLARQAKIEFLMQPSVEELNDRLWEQGWDILFFAGHSLTQPDSQQGIIQINEEYWLTIDELKYALKKAVEKGLQLAIFNSCDGLGLAQQLAEEAIYLPFVIVMREPVPDEVAPKFFRYFLEEYAKRGTALDSAIRNARERLHGLEKQYPCASWLPAFSQSSEKAPLTWQQLLNRNSLFSPPYRWRILRTVLVASLVITCLLMGSEWQERLRTWELPAYNSLKPLLIGVGSKLILIWPWWRNALWIWVWSLIGGLLAWQSKSLVDLGAYAIALGILYGLYFVFLTQGIMIPLLASAIALLITGTCLTLYIIFQCRV
ncbi:CHAT domain-containing protein [Microseira sp. BLCC-F43]|jgi:hypothetical protein|uniref:CHAT domain-containing protein n=1 Tax=Microseira sp. BLCC-F43 TaxID=3153602 RepID=UPI0035B97247